MEDNIINEKSKKNKNKKNSKIIISIIILVFLVIGVIDYVYIKNIWEDKVTTIISLDINPSIEIRLTESKKVKRMIPINNDAIDILSNEYNGKTLDEALSLLVDKIMNKGYIEEDKVSIILNSKGDIESKEFETIIRGKFEEKNIYPEITVIEEITKEDEELAEKYNISKTKASFINSINIENDNEEIEKLINKTVKELKEVRNSGYYCDEGYILEGSICLKEIKRIKAKTGNVCPENYYEYEGICYEEKRAIEGEKDICPEDSELIGEECVRNMIMDSNGICENGEYDIVNDVCHEEAYIADAYEFCRDPGRTLYDHKCLATKPTINGGCLGNDKLLNGKCVNTRDDYYDAEWKCPNGRVISNADGSLIFPDHKCYEEKTSKPISYACEEGFILNDKKCTRTEINKPYKERFCPSGYTLVNNDRCIDFKNIKEKQNGYICDYKDSRLENDTCILYEIKEANNINNN